jgi:hypothetical protein
VHTSHVGAGSAGRVRAVGLTSRGSGAARGAGGWHYTPDHPKPPLETVREVREIPAAERQTEPFFWRLHTERVLD